MEKYGSSWVNASTFYALQNRGLAERVNEFSGLPETVVSSLSPRISLTEAGRAVIPLLKMAGLYIDYPVRESGVDLLAPTVKLKEQTNTKDDLR